MKSADRMIKKVFKLFLIELEFQVYFIESNIQKVVQKLRIITGEVTHRSNIVITIG
jgi:hypothetical protein